MGERERERKFENGPINAQIQQSGKKEKIREKKSDRFLLRHIE